MDQSQPGEHPDPGGNPGRPFAGSQQTPKSYRSSVAFTRTAPEFPSPEKNRPMSMDIGRRMSPVRRRPLPDIGSLGDAQVVSRYQQNAQPVPTQRDVKAAALTDKEVPSRHSDVAGMSDGSGAVTPSHDPLRSTLPPRRPVPSIDEEAGPKDALSDLSSISHSRSQSAMSVRARGRTFGSQDTTGTTPTEFSRPQDCSNESSPSRPSSLARRGTGTPNYRYSTILPSLDSQFFPPGGNRALSRTPSPPKNSSDFAQAAMVRRHDSLNKRWSMQARPPDSFLERQSSINSAASSNSEGGISRFNTTTTSTTTSTTSTSTTTGATTLSQKATSDGLNSKSHESGLHAHRPSASMSNLTSSIPASSSASRKPLPTISDSPQFNPSTAQVSSPPSPGKRWSPQKSSWLESALLSQKQPVLESPAMKPKLNDQPSWMAELAKAKAKSTRNHENTKPDASKADNLSPWQRERLAKTSSIIEGSAGAGGPQKPVPSRDSIPKITRSTQETKLVDFRASLRKVAPSKPKEERQSGAGLGLSTMTSGTPGSGSKSSNYPADETPKIPARSDPKAKESDREVIETPKITHPTLSDLRSKKMASPAALSSSSDAPAAKNFRSQLQPLAGVSKSQAQKQTDSFDFRANLRSSGSATKAAGDRRSNEGEDHSREDPGRSEFHSIMTKFREADKKNPSPVIPSPDGLSPKLPSASTKGSPLTYAQETSLGKGFEFDAFRLSRSPSATGSSPAISPSLTSASSTVQPIRIGPQAESSLGISKSPATPTGSREGFTIDRSQNSVEAHSSINLSSTQEPKEGTQNKMAAISMSSNTHKYGFDDGNVRSSTHGTDSEYPSHNRVTSLASTTNRNDFETPTELSALGLTEAASTKRDSSVTSSKTNSPTSDTFPPSRKSTSASVRGKQPSEGRSETASLAGKDGPAGLPEFALDSSFMDSVDKQQTDEAKYGKVGTDGPASSFTLFQLSPNIEASPSLIDDRLKTTMLPPGLNLTSPTEPAQRDDSARTEEVPSDDDGVHSPVESDMPTTQSEAPTNKVRAEDNIDDTLDRGRQLESSYKYERRSITHLDAIIKDEEEDEEHNVDYGESRLNELSSSDESSSEESSSSSSGGSVSDTQSLEGRSAQPQSSTSAPEPIAAPINESPSQAEMVDDFNQDLEETLKGLSATDADELLASIGLEPEITTSVQPAPEAAVSLANESAPEVNIAHSAKDTKSSSAVLDTTSTPAESTENSPTIPPEGDGKVMGTVVNLESNITPTSAAPESGQDSESPIVDTESTTIRHQGSPTERSVEPPTTNSVYDGSSRSSSPRDQTRTGREQEVANLSGSSMHNESTRSTSSKRPPPEGSDRSTEVEESSETGPSTGNEGFILRASDSGEVEMLSETPSSQRPPGIPSDLADIESVDNASSPITNEYVPVPRRVPEPISVDHSGQTSPTSDHFRDDELSNEDEIREDLREHDQSFNLPGLQTVASPELRGWPFPVENSIVDTQIEDEQVPVPVIAPAKVPISEPAANPEEDVTAKEPLSINTSGAMALPSEASIIEEESRETVPVLPSKKPSVADFRRHRSRNPSANRISMFGADAATQFALFFGFVPALDHSQPPLDPMNVLQNSPYGPLSPKEPQRSRKTVKLDVYRLVEGSEPIKVNPRLRHMLYASDVYAVVHFYQPASQGSNGSPNGLLSAVTSWYSRKASTSTELYMWVGSKVSKERASDAVMSAQFAGKLSGATGREDTTIVHQGKELPEFINAFDTPLVSILSERPADETAAFPEGDHLFSVRKYLDKIIVDETDKFCLKKLCSGFPYLVVTGAGSMSARVIVWKGKGSQPEELVAASEQANELSKLVSTSSPLVQEVDEGSETADFLNRFPDNDPSLLPHYSVTWKRRPTVRFNTRFFNVSLEAAQERITIQEMAPFSVFDLRGDGVIVIDAWSSIYVLPSPTVRAHPEVFTKALSFAQDYSILAPSMDARPFMPTAELIMEGFPRDVKALFRGWIDNIAWSPAVNGSTLDDYDKDAEDEPVMPLGLTASLAALRRQ